MAATGEDAAAMDSISKAPIPPSALNFKAGDQDPQQEISSGESGLAENQPTPSKKSSSNSKYSRPQCR